MKNFDQERESRPQRPVEERTFVLGGETFVLRDRVRPEAYAPMDSLKEAKRDRMSCGCGHPRVAHGPNAGRCQHPGCDCKEFSGMVVEDGSTMQEVIDALDGTFVAMVEDGDGSHGRYRAIRERDWDIIEIEDIRAVVEWLIEESTARPTGRPSSSTTSPERTGDTSTVVSSSPVIQAA